MSEKLINAIIPKLPMRNKVATLDYYKTIGFGVLGTVDYPDYLMMERDGLQLHFFLFEELNPLENYGQIYVRTQNIQSLYKQLLENKVAIHPNGSLQTKPWGQIEFSLLDPDHNLVTFGQNA